MLIIVQELMYRTFVEAEGRAPRRHEIPKPCDHFDLIVGTGTGGLIALMLGRMRLDLETCKELYVRMTRVVFETDKTIAGIPYRSTLFKASKLEEAIQQAVQEHTSRDKDENDGRRIGDLSSALRGSLYSSSAGPRRNPSNASTLSFSARSPTTQMARPAWTSRHGDPHARLYDARENRTKTAVTAVYQGSPRGSPPALLRSYDSRREPPPEFDCKIWQAGRATSAIGLAFKPIRIGQSIFHDDGAGTFNPAPDALDEATVNEWPGREIGVFVSVGTGRRPKTSDANSTAWYEGFMGEFVEARRRLIAKIEGCEEIHEYMLREHLAKRGVNVENYYRLNVEVGVGEFGMNEWHRLGDISTGTRRYMAREAEQRMIHGISTKLARIFRAKIRWERAQQGIPALVKSTSTSNFHMPLAVELPGDMPVFPQFPPRSPPSRSSFESGSDSLPIDSKPPVSPCSSHDRIHTGSPGSQGTRPVSAIGRGGGGGGRDGDGSYLGAAVSSSSPNRYSSVSETDKIAIMSPDEHPRLPPQQAVVPPATRIEPPPLPPKTPLPPLPDAANHQHMSQLPSLPPPPQTPLPPLPDAANRQHMSQQLSLAPPPKTALPPLPGAAHQQHPPQQQNLAPLPLLLSQSSIPPYPVDDEGPPPPVNMARKPEYRAH
ncbi:hypothetical protein E4U43_000337 [Claviceps pusilla]|uniref:PNPLA domain-containing protein n=1 Tax=Claviceps pusilla TaxID=123648 RepID=A0A9P7SWT5_9HYPO|nr:hypothetical protein E4U43_000337 [Claviceps pusilla]